MLFRSEEFGRDGWFGCWAGFAKELGQNCCVFVIGCFDYCLNYFGISKSSLQLSSPYSVDDPDFQFCTTTPFILKTDIVLEMVSYMEFLEKMDFSQLFEHHKEGTEFYFYISYLILKQYISQYHLQKKIHVTLWPDLDKEWNQIESIEHLPQLEHAFDNNLPTSEQKTCQNVRHESNEHLLRSAKKKNGNTNYKRRLL